MKLLSQLHARFGDFWWYTGLQFAALRCGDLINAFIGLWLVPKYVGMEELGAVLPLMNFAAFFSLPISVFSTAFAKQVNVLLVRGEMGKLKTLLRGVFMAVGVFLVLSVVIVRFGLPLVLERVRVAKGSLGIVIVSAGLLTSLAPVYMNTLQSMKCFSAVSVINLCCAPIRLVTMLVAMPIRALTGYFVGQASAPCFQIIASVFSIRRELCRSDPGESYWSKSEVVATLRYMGLISINTIMAAMIGFVEPLIIRQRLPEIESAAYYMISRFAEIGSYLGITLIAVLFPYVSESNERGGRRDPLIIKAMLGTVGFGLACAIVFLLLGERILILFPNGENYVNFIPQLVQMTILTALVMASGCFATGEIAANRFGWLIWSTPFGLFYLATLLLLTGHGYLRGFVSDQIVDIMASFDVCHLNALLNVMFVAAVARLFFIGVQLFLRRGKQ